MNINDWIQRWEDGSIGWHEPYGNNSLKEEWNFSSDKVLIPLCGKSPDIKWLALRGHDVVGVEISDVAIRQFFEEQNLKFRIKPSNNHNCYECIELPINIYSGDFFNFNIGQFDALYDRAALIALDMKTRLAYVKHLRKLLKITAKKFVVTLEYDQDVIEGPPFSVLSNEIQSYWPDIEKVFERDDWVNCPPKFKRAGIKNISEVVWKTKF